MGDIDGMSEQEIVDYYNGIAPQEWVEHTFMADQSVAMSGQILRPPFVGLSPMQTRTTLTPTRSVGGASAGAITTVALGISNQGDFRDELSLEQV